MFSESAKEKLIIASIVICVLLGLHTLIDHWLHNPLKLAKDGKIASGPVQSQIFKSQPIAYNNLILTPVARYDIEARLLSKAHYYVANGTSFTNYDYALGWGKMSDPKIYSALRIGQMARFYYYSWGGEGPPIPAVEIVRSSSNNHLIAIDQTVASKIANTREGSMIRIQGYLVNAASVDGSWSWKTSMTRDDSGAGACETILVNDIHVF